MRLGRMISIGRKTKEIKGTREEERGGKDEEQCKGRTENHKNKGVER